MSDLQDKLQSILGDPYRLERELTAGGMSRLFLATETTLDRAVVVKLLPPDLVSEQSLARFRREVDITAHLQHPHVLPVLGAGARDGYLYYIMPFVAGESLRHRLDSLGALPLVEGLRLLREVADALAYAHSRDVIHRDIKPENILIEEGHAVLADFGIARAVFGSARETTRVTATGLAIGTLGYMAPEQLFGDAVDARADIYSLAVVAYEMLSGAPPFSAKSSQELVAAHLMETPKPLAELVAGMPPVVSDAIAKALAKTPDARLQTAAELRDAIETGLSLIQTRSFTGVSEAAAPRPASARWRRWAAASGAVAVIALAGGLALRARAGSSLDRNLVAVAPFDVSGADLGLWREGMVDVLARKLDGAGPLRTVSPSTVIRRWSGSADAAALTSLARETGAGLVIVGDLARRGGGDSIALRARAVDGETGRSLGDVEMRGRLADMGRFTDAMTIRLLAELGQMRAISATPRVGLAAGSLEALRAFLRGEQFYRRLAWDSARTSYERAIFLDSSFAPALRRAGLAISWQKSAQDDTVRAYLLRAGAHNRGLGARDSLLVAADSIRASLDGFDRDSAWLPRARRLFATLGAATSRYPDDAEVWYALGDAQWHYAFGPGVGVVDREILANFDRAIRLDPEFAPAYIHAIELALALDDATTASGYARHYLALEPAGVEAGGIRVADRIIELAEARSSQLDAVLDTTATAPLVNAWLMLRRWPDASETSVRVIRALYARRGREVMADTATLRQYLAVQLAYRGHVREAASVLGPVPSGFRVEVAMLGGIAPDSANAEFARWLAAGTPAARIALPWWGARRDTAMLRRTRAWADSVGAADPLRRRDARYTATAARAYDALARSDTATALGLFRALPDSLCIFCFLDRLDEARLLAAGGDDRAASLLADERIFALLSPSEVPEALLRGRIAERRREREKAIDAYTRVARAWANADTALRPMAAEAESALTRLGAVASRRSGARGTQ